MTEVHETDQTFEEWPGAGVKTLLPPSRMCDLGRVSPSLWQILGLHDGSQLSLRPPEEPLRDSGDKDIGKFMDIMARSAVPSMLT